MNNAPVARQNIDFSPLKRYGNSNTNDRLFYAVFIFVGMILVAMWEHVASSGVRYIEASEWLMVLILAFGLIAQLMYFALQEVKRDTINKQALKNFASRNGFYHAPNSSQAVGPGILFARKNIEYTIQDNISGQMRGLPFSFYWTYAVGDDKLLTTNHTVMELTLPRRLPHMVIDSSIADIHTLPFDFDESQKINLEGDFYKYFALYAPDTYSITALTILAPDAMMALIQHAQLCDIEIVENRLYFYWREYPENQQDIEDKFQTVWGVLEKIGDKIAYDNVFAVPSQARLHIEPGQSAKIKAPGFSLIGALKWWLMWDKFMGRYLKRHARHKLKKQLAETYGNLAQLSN